MRYPFLNVAASLHLLGGIVLFVYGIVAVVREPGDWLVLLWCLLAGVASVAVSQAYWCLQWIASAVHRIEQRRNG